MSANKVDVVSVASEVLLHHSECLLFLSLLEVQDLHFRLKTALLLPQTLILQLLLFELVFG